MDKVVKWGILGPGTIAHKFAQGLKALPDAELSAVGSRSKEKAEEFARRYAIPKSYGSYDELVNDPDIDVIYIATPHTFHMEHSLLCLNAGKAVLCEKPVSVNSNEAETVIACAREKRLFFMEAMWTRFLPAVIKAQELIKQGTIGEVRMLTADFGFRAGWEPENRLLKLELSGGGLLDVGVYTLAFASMIFGRKPSEVKSLAHLGSTGVDEQSAIVLGYDKGQLALLSSAIRVNTPQEARIMGTDGWIYIPDFWHASSLIVNIHGKGEERFDLPFEGTGYNYEAAEVMKCLREGKLESDIMPLEESFQIIRVMDEIRRQWGLSYPMEN